MSPWNARYRGRGATLFGLMGSLLSIACGDKPVAGDATGTKKAAEPAKAAEPSKAAEPAAATKAEASPAAMVEPKSPHAARVFRELASIDKSVANDAQR